MLLSHSTCYLNKCQNTKKWTNFFHTSSTPTLEVDDSEAEGTIMAQRHFQSQSGISTSLLVTESHEPQTSLKAGITVFSHYSCAVILQCGCWSKGWRKIARNRRQHSCKELLESRKLASRNIVTWLAESDVLLLDTEERMCLYLRAIAICRTINTCSTIIIHN